MSTEPAAVSDEKKPGEGAEIHEGSEDEKLQNARKQSMCFFSVIFPADG